MIRSFFRRWRPWHLLLAWCVYWAGLALVKLGPAIATGWRISRPGHTGSVNASITDGIVSANLIEAGRTVWTGSIPFSHLVLLVAVPPLVIWLVWLIGAARTNNAGESPLKNQSSVRELSATEPRIGIIETSSTSTSKRRTREES
ncbi:MAG TPA: hypothetical protein VFP77_06070 [Gemmatimonadaceae bacterium]|nr:hypothetical protein [Gemmatimonadaceae bacterium]